MNNVDTPEPLDVISLCTGLGGLDIGAHYGFGGRTKLKCFCERESYATTIIQARADQGRFPSTPCWTDLKTFPFQDFHGIPNLALFGGFPCQPFSVSGLREADADPRHLFPAIKRGIETCRPSLVLLENVDGIASAKLAGADETSVLRYVLETMESLGYLTEATSISAREIGAGHNRRRWFILGVLADPDNCGGLRVCRYVERISSAPSAVQGEGREPSEEVGHCGTRPKEFGDHAWDFPARPEQPQHGWEHSRILAHTTGEQDGGLDERGVRGLSDGSCYGKEGLDQEQAVPTMGSATDGPSCGLGDTPTFVGTEYQGDKLDFLMKDRQRALRLLGNSVCPQQAYQAVRILAPRVALRATRLANNYSTIEGMVRQSTNNPL
jgi:site-specific DNA-cytosine methylase